MIFNNIAEIHEVTDANIDSAYESLRASIRRAQRIWLTPFIGSALVKHAENIADGDNTDFPTTDGLAVDFLQATREALGPLAVYLYIPRAEAQLTDAGIRAVANNDQQQGAYKYQVIELQKSYLNDGLDALEYLLGWLEAHKTEIPDWTDTPEEKAYNDLFIRTGTEMDKYYKLSRPQLLYHDMRPAMKTIEDLVVNKVIGDTFQDLKSKQISNTQVFDEVVVSGLIKKAIANLTVWKAIDQQQVRMDENGLTIMSANADSTLNSDSKRQAADALKVSALQRSARDTGYSFLDEAIAYMKSKATDSIFPAYKPAPESETSLPDSCEADNRCLRGAFSM